MLAFSVSVNASWCSFSVVMIYTLLLCMSTTSIKALTFVDVCISVVSIGVTKNCDTVNSYTNSPTYTFDGLTSSRNNTNHCWSSVNNWSCTNGNCVCVFE